MICHIRVPGSTSNMGPGFDCLGAAISKYVTIKFKTKISGGRLVTVSGRDEGLVPITSQNLILKVAKKVAGKLPEHFILEIDNEIPLGAGLGSSGAATVAGVCLGLKLLKKKIKKEDVLIISEKIEGHGDNVAASVFGGWTHYYHVNKMQHCFQLPMYEGWKWMGVLSKKRTSTKAARKILPSKIDLSKVTQNVMAFGVLNEALISGDKDLLSLGLVDHIHQDIRLKCVLGLPKLFKLLAGASDGAYLSGSGPTVMAIYHDDSQIRKIKKIAETSALKPELIPLEIDHDGVLWK